MNDKCSGLAPACTVVAHDAELAALAALEDPRLLRHPRVRVLTLGFSVGAALLDS
jgi:hypothetical protein